MSQEAGGAGSETEGPMWGRFFDSIGSGETESTISGQPTDMLNSKHVSMRGTPQLPQSPRSDLHPNDSASVVMEDNGSVLDDYMTKGGSGSQVASPSPQLRPKVEEVVSPLERATADWDGVLPPRAHAESIAPASLEPLSDSTAHGEFEILILP